MDRSRRLRSRMRFCAVCASFQNCGDSDLAFSSSRRRTDLSQSKMPPQQGEGLLDLGDGPFGLGAHGKHLSCRRGYKGLSPCTQHHEFPAQTRRNWLRSAKIANARPCTGLAARHSRDCKPSRHFLAARTKVECSRVFKRQGRAVYHEYRN